MYKPLEIYIGLRYTRAKRRNHFISFISLSSMLGIALGVTALITVLSVMNGFERELRERILGMASHATITGLDGTLSDWELLTGKVSGTDRVVGVAPFVSAEAMLTNRSLVRGAIIRGIDPQEEPSVAEVVKYMQVGSPDDLEAGKYNIILGAGLARRLGASVGGKVTLVAPQANISPAGILPRLRRFTVTGLFEVKHGQFDSGLGLIHLSDARRMFKLGDRVSGLRLKLDDLYAAPRVSREIAKELGGAYWVRDWTQHHANFFRALKTEKTVMFVILTLIVAVAAFNIISTLVMVVTDKQPDIAILRTLGASPRSIMGIFIVQGCLIGIVGTFLGVVGGIALASNVDTLVPAIESLFETKFLSPDIYYISDVPSDLRTADVAVIACVSLVLSVFATIYPAVRASRVQPAEALRYE